MSKVEQAVKNLEKAMSEEGVNPINGLPEELFVFATTLMPVPNIDLFITNQSGQVLLTWRDDRYYGIGWHIPGGYIRMRETLESRIQKTALNEIGAKVDYDTEPIVVREAFVNESRPWLKNQLERAHNISLLFQCRLPDGFEIDNGKLQEHDAGYAKWFDSIPSDLLKAHKDLYGDIFDKWFSKREIRK